MKKILLVLIATGASFNFCEAQTWNEWFRQKKTQKQYLIQQIAALKVYLKYLKEGYDIAQKGLNLVGDIKDGNFNDHSTYFESLRLVNSSIRSSPKISLIIAYQVRIVNDFRALQKDCRGNRDLTEEEMQYIEKVYEKLLTECETSISDLNVMITDNASQLKDDERIERIDLIYEDMTDKHSFARAFCNSTRMLMAQRSRELHEIEGSRKLNSVL
jgi:hypothetical protein